MRGRKYEHGEEVPQDLHQLDARYDDALFTEPGKLYQRTVNFVRRRESSARTKRGAYWKLFIEKGKYRPKGVPPGAQIDGYTEGKPLGFVKNLEAGYGGGYISIYAAPEMTGLLPN